MIEKMIAEAMAAPLWVWAVFGFATGQILDCFGLIGGGKNGR